VTARPDGITIRESRPADRSAIEVVTLAAYEQYAAVLPAPLWEAYRQNIVATLADAQPATQIVAEVDGALVGSVLMYPAGADTGAPGRGKTMMLVWPEVRLLAVAPAARGSGAGRRLMEECIRRARASGATAITLHTTDMMQRAMELYQRMGFERAPDLDFSPAQGITVKGYRLALRVS
jgi:predicted N-acetyltransferase YhbS